METYNDRRKYADNYVPAQIAILENWLGGTVSVASDILDCKSATDFVSTAGLRIGGRVRRQEHIAYANEVTIRLTKGPDGQCEWSKVKDGKVRYMLYGFAGDNGTLSQWTIVDLRYFAQLPEESLPIPKTYSGGSFYPFDLTEHPKAIVSSSATVTPSFP